jgi:hypothetical protein
MPVPHLRRKAALVRGFWSSRNVHVNFGYVNFGYAYFEAIMSLAG